MNDTQGWRQTAHNAVAQLKTGPDAALGEYIKLSNFLTGEKTPEQQSIEKILSEALAYFKTYHPELLKKLNYIRR